MLLKAKQRLLFLRSLKDLQGEEGFTLVELIVVVMIIGILSSIAVPQFLSVSDKAKQKEATSLVNGYLKAASMYYIEHGAKALNSGNLGENMVMLGCSKNDPTFCKDSKLRNLGYPMGHDSWFMPSGHYRVHMTWSNPQGGGPRTYFQVYPTANYPQGYGVTGCYNNLTGAIKVLEMTERGYKVPRVNC